MRTFFFLSFCLLRIAYSAAQAPLADSVRISLSKKSVGKTVRVSAADGSYKIPASQLPEKRRAVPGTFLVRPAELYGWDSVVKITALPQLAADAPYYEFRPGNFPYDRGKLQHTEYIDMLKQYMRTHPDDSNSIVQRLELDTIGFAWRDANGNISVYRNYYVKYDSFEHYTDSVIASLQTDFRNYRAQAIQPVLNDVLTPFYVSVTEVTNGQYRQFVNWTRDSIAFSILYDSLPPPEAAQLLKCTKKQRAALVLTQKAENLRIYGFDFTALNRKNRSFYDDPRYIDLLKNLYYPQAARFYKRREIDVRKLLYGSAAISPTPVYPDTLSWLRDDTTGFYGTYTHMYFWHPAYDNNPVVGLSEQQMNAYCDWLSRRKNGQLAAEGQPYTARIVLPQLYHYEMAVKTCALRSRQITIDAFPDPAFLLHRTPMEALTFITTVYSSAKINPEAIGDEPVRKFYQYQRANATEPIFGLATGVSEYCADGNPNDSVMTFLGANRSMGLVDPHENQLNTVFYQRRVPASGGSSLNGFRTVMYIERKR